MLVTPEDVRAYSVFAKVKKRADEQLRNDILEATVEVENIVGHDFSDKELYDPLPHKVKLALCKLTQFYALINSDEKLIKGFKSERFENYSYTLADGETVRKPDLSILLRDYIVLPIPVENKPRFRMRPL